MAGRRWTPEEIAQMEELAAVFPTKQVAQKLGRSHAAVLNKMSRTGIQSYPAMSDALTLHQMQLLLGVEYKTVMNKWVSKGLKVRRKGMFRMVTQHEMLRYLKEHPEDWNAKKVTDEAIFTGCEWFEEKKKTDTLKARAWTPAEIATLKIRYRQGRPLRDVAAELGRSENGVKNKLLHMRKHQGYRL